MLTATNIASTWELSTQVEQALLLSISWDHSCCLIHVLQVCAMACCMCYCTHPTLYTSKFQQAAGQIRIYLNNNIVISYVVFHKRILLRVSDLLKCSEISWGSQRQIYSSLITKLTCTASCRPVTCSKSLTITPFVYVCLQHTRDLNSY